jgi:hypothetical protein
MKLENADLNYERWDRMDLQQETLWCGHDIKQKMALTLAETYLSDYINRIAKELAVVISKRPLIESSPQDYYTYKSREEQINYELSLIQSTREFLEGRWMNASLLYMKAFKHLQQRTSYEQKAFGIWLERVKAKENPPMPDIGFINQGIPLSRLI